MPTSVDLSHVIALQSLADVVETLDHVTDDLADRTLIVGATARDVILHHVHQMPIARATADLDLAVAIGNWRAFEALRRRLIDAGARQDPQMIHRLELHEWTIDIIPFGGVEHNGTIVWPETEARMSVMGFDEASRHAIHVLLPNGASAFIASPPALLILKLIAWKERHLRQPRHDAVDIRTLIDSYAAAWNENRLYDEADDLLQKFRYDNALAAAALLGRDAATIANTPTLQRILAIIRDEVNGDTLTLAADMRSGVEANLSLLGALLIGVQGVAFSQR